MEKLFDAVIKLENGKIDIQSKIPQIDEEFFKKHIKDLECGKIEVDGKTFWVIKKDNVYLVDKFDCLTKFMEDIEKKAIYDALTNCYNKRETEEFIKKFLYNYLRYKKDFFTIMMLDIDHFKKINDTYGHHIGDIVLRDFSLMIKNNIRESDLFARIGGEEFVILTKVNDIEQLYNIAEKLLYLTRSLTIRKDDTVLKITISIGGYIFNPLEESLESALHKADMALYQAKETRNTFVIFPDLKR